MSEVVTRISPVDEHRHPHDGELLWNESYYLDWFDEAGTLGGYLRIGFYPNMGKVWYWACAVGPDRKLVTVIDHEVPMPATDSSLEVRHVGLWADNHIAAPLVRMSCDLESFAVEVDDAVEMYQLEPRGNRVPFGFELDFETDRGGYLWPPVTARYEIPCRVTGKLMVADEVIEFDGWGQRDHSWGSPRDWWTNHWCWTAGRLSDGTRFHAAGAFFDESDWGVGYVLEPTAGEFAEFDVIKHAATLGAEGLVETATIGIGALELTVTPLAWSPVLLVHPDGRQARFPRAMARFDASDGRSGIGWVEWNQPQG